MTTTSIAQPRKIKIRAVALPTEHGGWAFILNPIILGVWATTSIVYVRTRLRLENGKNPPHYPVYLIHALGFILIGIAVLADKLPWGSVIAILVLTLRATWGISPYRRPLKAIMIGIREVFYGFLMILIIALSYSLLS